MNHSMEGGEKKSIQKMEREKESRIYKYTSLTSFNQTGIDPPQAH